MVAMPREGKLFAWGLLVPNQTYVERALVAAHLHHNLRDKSVVLCFVGSSISLESLTKLEDMCDHVVFRKHFNDSDSGLGSHDELLLMDAINSLSDGIHMLNKIAFLHPDVVILGRDDSIFKQHGVVYDSEGEWSIIVADTSANGSGKAVNSLEEFCKTVGTHGGVVRAVSTLSDLSTSASYQRDIKYIKLSGNGIERMEHVLRSGGVWHEIIYQKIKSTLERSLAATGSSHAGTHDWIAVVGMSCRFPQANSLEEYWSILEEGRNTSSTPPAERVQLCALDPSLRANWLQCRVDHFDAEFFGIAPSEAEFMDPQSRLALEVSWEALEDAGIAPDSLRGSATGVFYGSWLQDYKEIMNLDSPSTSDTLRKYMSNGFGCSAAKLSFFYGLAGPNIASESGCSSSIVAVDLAVKSLIREECNLALATGSNLILQWKEKKNVVWAPDGISKTFDGSADGYGRAEGVAVLILKRYSEAVASNDKIYGVICGSGVSQEGESPSFGSPTVKSEAAAMKACLRSAGLSPSDVDFIEAHGTGTALGDPVEAAAIIHAYSTSGAERSSPLYIASGKTNVGHTESCSGIAGIIKVLLSMQHEMMPPHLSVTHLNPKLNFEQIGARIPFQSVPWPRNLTRPRIAAVSSFGITGTDAQLMLREAPVRNPPPPHLASVNMTLPHLLTLSARTAPALEQLTLRYLNFLEKNERINFSLTNVAYTANACRAKHSLRRVITGRTAKELGNKIRAGEWTDGCCSATTWAKKGSPKVCFTFPGAIGEFDMAAVAELYQTFPVFRMSVESCEAAYKASSSGGLTLLPAFNKVNNPVDSPALVAGYATTVAVQYSLAQLWSSWGLRPDFAMGHCGGEIVACMVAGMLRLEDGFRLVSVLERIVAESAPGAGEMLAVRGDGDQVGTLIQKYLATAPPDPDQFLDVSALNSRTQTVVSGSPSAIVNFAAFCSEREEVRAKRVQQLHLPIHSRGIEPTLEQFRAEFPEHFRPPRIPYVSSVTGGILVDGDVSSSQDYWFRCFRNEVKFTSACQTAAGSTLGAELFLEIGPGSTLTKLTLENVAGDRLCIPSFGRRGGIVESVASLSASGVDIDWSGYYLFHPVSKVPLPHYPFQRKAYWYNKRKGAEENGRHHQVFEARQIQHPLLGGKVSLADRTEKVTFESRLSHSSTAMSFITDHLIGQEVVFPAAGYVEMMLAAAGVVGGGDDLDCSTSSPLLPVPPTTLCIQNLLISAPLLVSSSGEHQTKLQTVIQAEPTPTPQQASKVSVYAERRTVGDDWRLHASGVVPRCSTPPLEVERSLDLRGILERVPIVPNGAPDFYEELASMGLNFGESFRSISSFHRNEEETIAEVRCPRAADDAHHRHIVHPILIDSMIQTWFVARGAEFRRRLHVPLAIQKFLLIPSSEFAVDCSRQGQQRFYVYCKPLENNIFLVDHHGRVRAVMEGPVLAPTTASAVVEAGRERCPLSTYEVGWDQARIQLPALVATCRRDRDDGCSLSYPPISTLAEEGSSGRREWIKEEERLEENINRLCLLYVLNMLYEMGWEPRLGKQWLLADAISEFKVKDSLALAFSRFLDFLVEDGSLERQDGGGQLLTLTCPPPPWEAVKKELGCSLELVRNYPALKVIAACGASLRAVLQDDLSGQYILFGKGEGEEPLAETYYSNNRFLDEHVAALGKCFERACQEVAGQGRIRILEVGAGTGLFTRVAFKSLAEAGASFQYHFTDISPAFFEGAKERFRGNDETALVVYKTLDIEKDPLDQGFPPDYFDIVVGVDVFHATSDLQNTIRNVGLVTRPDGVLLIGETECPVREIDITFGILSGYWAFQDSSLRRSHCLVGAEVWKEVLRGCGFPGAAHLLTGGGRKSVIVGRLSERERSAWDDDIDIRRGRSNVHASWLAIGEHFPNDFEWLVGRMRGVGRALVVRDCSSSSAAQGLENLLTEFSSSLGATRFEGILVFAGQKRKGNSEEWQDRRNLLKTLFSAFKTVGQGSLGPSGSPLPALHLVTTGTWASDGHEGDFSDLDPSGGALWGLARSARMELPELVSKSFDLDPAASSMENMERLLTELWLGDDAELEVLHRQGLRYVRRLRTEKKRQQATLPLEFPLSPRFEVSLPESRAISDIRFVPKAEAEAGGGKCPLLSGQQVEVRLSCASLNFRDVLVVVKPTGSVFESMSGVGIDFAGVVTRIGPGVQRLRVGQRVYGLSTHESTISSHIVTEESHGIQIPPGLTFAHAAGLPVVFLTVWYSMVVVAGVTRGQRVLVHAVTGGVGLVAIQIAKILGVEVIGTAGSPRKRNFARSLGLKHVFSSRDLEFGDQAIHATGGAGVDMVLNCLTGPGFKEASLGLLKDGGHFVELSKLDVWSEQEVRSRRPAVHYQIVSLPEVEPELISDMMAKMNELVESGVITPLPSTRFLASQLPSALATLQRAKQIGKVIVDLPIFEPEQNRFVERLFASDRTYLITGGLGAIGLAVAKWMVSQGAKHLALVGRSAPSQVALEDIRQLREQFQATVVCSQADISSYEQCTALFESLFSVGGCYSLPPLGGIHHCAGILSDKLLVNQDWEQFESVVKPKADGLFNLHRLTAHLPLQFFVTHSSLISTVGNVGQSNYAAGNAYMDSLIEARVQTGLKGLVINWGRWKTGLAEHVEVKIANPFSVQDGIAALERFFLENNKTAVVAAHVDFHEATKMFPNYKHTFLRNMDFGERRNGNEEGDVGTGNSKCDPFLLQFNKQTQEGQGMSEEQKEKLVVGFVRELACSILGLGIHEIEDSAEFSVMGMDSLMSIDFTNKLQAELPGLSVGYIDMEEFGSVKKMSGFVKSLIPV